MEGECEWRMSGGKRPKCGCPAEFLVSSTKLCCELHLSRAVLESMKEDKTERVSVEKI